MGGGGEKKSCDGLEEKMYIWEGKHDETNEKKKKGEKRRLEQRL